MYKLFKKFLVFGFILRYLIEGYLELTILCMLNFYEMKFSDFLSSTGSIISLAMILIVSIAPLFVPTLIYFNQDKLDEESFK